MTVSYGILLVILGLVLGIDLCGLIIILREEGFLMSFGDVSKTGRVERSGDAMGTPVREAGWSGRQESDESLLKEKVASLTGKIPESDGFALHQDGDKEPIHLIPPEVLMALATVYKFGAAKYSDPRNWERGMGWSRLYDSAMRHLLKFWGGEDDDPESGLPHIWHAMWNVCALAWYRNHHGDLDDRPRKPKATPPKNIPQGWSIVL